MIQYERRGRTYRFDPLPVNRNTATLFSSIAELSKTREDGSFNVGAVASLIGALPEAIARSMRDHHTEHEVNAFIDTILLDFSDPASLSVLFDLQMLFMGVDPQKARTKEKDAATST